MINQLVIKQIIEEQQAILLPKPLVLRESWQKLVQYQGNTQIVIIKGVRRCGKSIALQWLRFQEKAPYFYFNFDDDRLIDFTVQDFQLLLETLVEISGPARIVYFDEIQNILGWERFIRRLHDQGYKIYLTGSNAQLLSQEFGTHLTGRTISIEMYPYAFVEFLRAKEISYQSDQYSTDQRGLLKNAFNQYMKLGGIPDYVRFEEPQYLKDLYHNILYRDIIVRHKIQNEHEIKSLAHYLASHIGKDMSYNSLKSVIKVAHATTVSDYCYYIEMSYLCFIVNQYSDSLKAQSHYGKKSYFIDPALAKTVGFQTSEEYGRTLENIVFLELKRRAYEVYFYRGDNECDFIIKSSHNLVQAIQVCAHLDHSETYAREMAGLREAMKRHHLKTGLILTDNTERSEGEITIMPVWRWLLSVVLG